LQGVCDGLCHAILVHLLVHLLRTKRQLHLNIDQQHINAINVDLIIRAIFYVGVFFVKINIFWSLTYVCREIAINHIDVSELIVLAWS
jgi:hypothetical protein